MEDSDGDVSMSGEESLHSTDANDGSSAARLMLAMIDGASKEAIQSILASSSGIHGNDLFEIIVAADDRELHDDHPEACALLIEHGARDLETTRLRRHNGRFLLHYASIFGVPVAVIELLLEMNPDAVRAQDGEGMLPLHVAVAENAPDEVIGALLRSFPLGAGMKNRGGNLPIHFAVWEDKVETVNLLINAFPYALCAANDSGSLPIHEACEMTGSHQVVQALMEHYDGNPLHCYGLAVADNDEQIPLHLALSNDCITTETLQLLLDSYAEGTRAADNDGNLPLHVACMCPVAGSLERIRLLLEVDIFTILKVRNTGATPLQLAFDDDDRQPLAVRQFLLENQDEALRLLHGAFEPTVENFRLPDLVVAEIWGFVLPPIWRPTDDEMNA